MVEGEQGGGLTVETDDPGVASATDQKGDEPKRRYVRSVKPKGGTTEPIYGRRPMKYYNVNDSDLAQLSTFGGLASWSFALGALLVGTSFDLVKDLAMGAAPSVTTKAFWEGVQWPLAAFGGIFLLIALLLTLMRWSKANAVKKETKFDEQ
ncbi:MAG: hypothetical protein WEB63_03495 [Cucumibacter sp.]